MLKKDIIFMRKTHAFLNSFIYWHVESLGARYVYIKSGIPHLNGKVERPHSIDEEGFYQMLEYKMDVDLAKKI